MVYDWRRVWHWERLSPRHWHPVGGHARLQGPCSKCGQKSTGVAMLSWTTRPLVTLVIRRTFLSARTTRSKYSPAWGGKGESSQPTFAQGRTRATPGATNSQGWAWPGSGWRVSSVKPSCGWAMPAAATAMAMEGRGPAKSPSLLRLHFWYLPSSCLWLVAHWYCWVAREENRSWANDTQRPNWR